MHLPLCLYIIHCQYVGTVFEAPATEMSGLVKTAVHKHSTVCS